MMRPNGIGRKDIGPVKTDMTHTVGLFLPPDYQLLDVAGPMAVFEAASPNAGEPAYVIELLSSQGGAMRSSNGATLNTRAVDAGAFDTLLICGGIGAVTARFESAALNTIVSHYESGRRIGSVCTGAFLLAHAGCLDSRRATTHWRYAEEFSRLYPNVEVEVDRIWVRDETVWTSAGVSAGMDLAMAMVAEDKGSAVSKGIAQELVIYYRRPGGQSQFSTLLDKGEPEGRFSRLLEWIRENLEADHSVERLADKMAMSPRNFSRAFLKETGMQPARAVQQIRLESAREWVQRGTHSLTHISQATGFGSSERMRNAFLRNYGASPSSFRRAF